MPRPQLTGKNADWMADFTDRDDLTLCDITFPASHDAGLTHAEGGFSAYVAGGASGTICQYYDIQGQLETGSRAFDLRMKKKSGTVRCFHGTAPLGGWGHKAQEIFEQVDDFLQAHTGEIVILRISHTPESAEVHNLIRSTIKQSRLVTCGPRNLAVEPLSKMRGKALAIFDKAALEKTNPMLGLHRLKGYLNKKTGTVNPPSEGLPICGKYAGKSADQKKVIKVAREFGNQHGQHSRNSKNKHDHLFMIYWQEAMNVEAKATKGNDTRMKNLSKMDKKKGLHYNLDYLLNLHRGLSYVNQEGSNIRLGNRMYHRPNWINLDFICDDVVDKVVEFNTEFLPPRD